MPVPARLRRASRQDAAAPQNRLRSEPPHTGRRALALALFLALTLAACGSDEGAAGAGPLRVALVPNQDPAEVKAEYAPLARYLERKVGRPVELTVPTGYPAVVESMANDRTDLALFGGLTYVQARARAKVSPLVTDVNPETGTTAYDSAIVVPASSPARRVADLRGEDFAFGSISSTSGSLYPSIMLREAGLDRRRDLGRVTYTGGHDATAAAVASGRVAGGGLEGRILRRLVRRGTVDGSKLRTLARSGPIEGYPWVARDALAPELRERIAEAFLTLRDPKLLKVLNAKGFERVRPADYDEVEREARSLGLLRSG